MALQSSLCIAALAGTVWGFPDVQKQVVNTEWWPPGTENSTEAVGIVSHGLVFMTAMMEGEETLNATLALEVSDVNDIAAAAYTDLDDLADCYLHARPGTGAAVRQAFAASLPATSKPCITVMETLGEYDWANNSVTCISAQPSAAGLHDGLRHDGDTVTAGGLIFVPGVSGGVEGGLATQLPAALDKVERTVGGPEHLVDCLVLVRDTANLGQARDILSARYNETAPALTLVQAGLEKSDDEVVVKCIAAKDTADIQRMPNAVVASQYVFTSGQVGQFANGTDAFEAVEQALAPSGLDLSDVVNCAFFVQDLANMPSFFSGFYWTFNVAHFPPPSRGEFVTGLECSDCTIVAKCIAAFPVPDISQV